MPAETERVLALGGEVTHTPLGKYETDFYLQRVSIFTCSLAVSVALLVSMLAPLFEKRQAEKPKPQRFYREIPAPSPPPRIRTTKGVGPARVEIKKRAFSLPKPVPDEDVSETVEWSEVEVLPGLENNGLGFSGPEPTLQVDSWGVVPYEPEVFLFVEVPPVLVSMEAPTYPDLAREAGVEGVVLVKVLVSEEGFVLDTLVLEGVPMLSEAASAAAQTAVFKPAQQSNQPVRTWVVVPIEFTLR